MATKIELVTAEGITRGFTFETVGRTSEICGTLKPSKRVDLVLRLTSVVTTIALSFERRGREGEGPGTSDWT